MSHEAVTWAMDDAPILLTQKGRPDTTARYVLWALAEHARPDGTNVHPSVLRLQYRTGLDARTVQRALRRLETAKLIVAVGEVQGRTKWRLALHVKRPEFDWAELEAEAEERRKAGAERVRRHRAKPVTHSDDVAVTPPNGVTDEAVTHSEDVGNAPGVRYVTHSDDVCNALSAALTTNNHQNNHQGTARGAEEVPKPEGARDRTPEDPHHHPAGLEPFDTAPIDRDGFTLTDPMRRWAAATHPNLDVDQETALFIAHFRAECTHRRSWPAEWQKWMTRSAKFASERATRAATRGPGNVIPFSAARPSTTDQRVQAALALAAEFRALEEGAAR